MKIWPFGKLEHRAASSYGDAIIEALVGRAEGRSLAGAGATAALETCAGLIGRAFAAAEVAGPAPVISVLSPAVMTLVGRELIRRGEALFLIDTGGGLKLLPAHSWDVDGDPDPDSWTYRITLSGPSSTQTVQAPAASVLHFRYATDPSAPASGRGPLQTAALAGKLSAEVARVLGEEVSGPVGSLLGVPGVDGDDATVSGLKTDIASARGKVALMETGDWNTGGGDARVNLKTERFGPIPPPGLVALLSAASQEVYAACGLNASLFGGAGGAGAAREAWRLALFGVLAPLGRLVESELKDKLDDEVSLSWQELRASDLSGRARAFQSMVGGGMAVDQAVSVAGLMIQED